MPLVCPKCGNQSPLGRVFCVTCGSKLDLSHMSSEVVTASERPNWFAMYWSKLVIGLVVLIVVLIVVSLWPKPDALGETGVARKGDLVAQQLDQIRKLPPGRRVSVQFVEKDFNAFLESKAKKWEMKSLTIGISEGYFTVRVVEKVASFSIMEHKVELCYSYEIVCVPAGGKVAPPKVVFGHLPLVGPLRKLILNRFVGLLSAEKEWEAAKCVQELKCGDKKLSLVTGK